MMSDLPGLIYTRYKSALKRAEEAAQAGRAREAAAAYQQCAQAMRQYAEYAPDGKTRQKRVEQAAELERVAAELSAPAAAARPATGGIPRPPGSTLASAEDGDDYEAAARALIQTSRVRWDDIAGLDDTKAAIKSAYGLALARKPHGVQIDTWRNLLLFGPPGSGKTILAAATAGSLDATFFSVKVSNMLSKYFGESSKLITALYSVARSSSPAVIFLDEFDSLAPSREAGDSGAERRIVSTLLAELDGLATKDDDRFVLTMAATNLPWTFDDAILSRFARRIYVPLPDQAARIGIFERQITRKGHHSQVELKDLATAADGYSGREIEQVCQIALGLMTNRANPGLLAAVDKGREAVSKYQMRVEPISDQDFLTALAQVQPRTSPQTIARYTEWLRKVEA